MIKAVVFDLDDTLISENEYIKSGYKFISKIIEEKFLIDKNQVLLDLFNLFKVSPINVFNRLFDKYQILYSNEMLLDLVNSYRGHSPNIQFYGDVTACLMRLKSEEIKVGIITDGYSISQRQKLKVVKAEQYFDEIIITDELGRDYWKPHSKSFNLMKEKLEVDYDEMIYVGDNPLKDFDINKKYPIKTVRIFRVDGIYSKIKSHNNNKPMYEINKLDCLSEIIESINNN